MQPTVYPPVARTWPDQLISSLDVAALVALLGSLPTGTPIAVDTETTGLYPYQSDVIRGVSIAFRLHGSMIGDDELAGTNGIGSFYIPVGYTGWGQSLSEPDQRMIFRALKAVDPFLIFHHGKFDYAFLRQLPTDKDGSTFFGFPSAHTHYQDCDIRCTAPSTTWWDTKVVAWLLDENMSTGLKEQAAFHWGEDQRDEQKAIKKLIKERGGWDKLTPADTAQYAAKDAELTLRLYELQQQLVDGKGGVVGPAVRPAIARELAIQGVLSRMERTGILVNDSLILSMTADTQIRVDAIERTFADNYVNVNSPLQLAAYLYDELGLECKSKTPKGGRSVNRDALEALPSTPETRQLLEHRRLKKALTGYLTPLAGLIGADGRVHPTFWSMGTVTGRFSCSDPNLQTIPRGDTLTGVRDVFIAEDGFELWEYDLQAAEMRVMAGMANDEELMANLLRDDWDPHSELAATVFGPEFTGLQRRYAKNLRYGWQYGLTSLKTAAKYIDGPNAEKVAEKILAGLKKLHPKIVALMSRTTKAAERDGYVPIGAAWPGRYRRFVTQSQRRPQAFTALNAKVQGSIGEAMKDYMILAEERLAQVGARMCLQIHDALVIEVPEGMGEKVGEILQDIADKLSPFVMPMRFTAEPWSSHD